MCANDGGKISAAVNRNSVMVPQNCLLKVKIFRSVTSGRINFDRLLPVVVFYHIL